MIYIIGDLHFGVRKNSSTFHDILLEMLNIVQRKITKQDHIIFLGDIYDKRSNVDFHILNDSISFFESLCKKCKTVNILVGNHDLYYKENVYEHVNCRFLSSISKKISIINEISEKTFDGRKCLFVPWIDTNERYNLSKNRISSKYDIIFGHFDLNYGDDEQETFYMSDSLFSTEQHVFSGHFHQRKQSGKILYVGSLINQRFSDVGNVKGYYTLGEELKFHKVPCPTFEYLSVENPASFLSMYENLSEENKNKIYTKVHGNFIKLILSEYDPLNDKIYGIIKGMTPLELSIEYAKMDFDSGVDGESFKGFSSNENILSIISEYLEKTQKDIPQTTNQKIMEIVSNKYQRFQHNNSG